jgi:CrcB protein
MRGEFDTPPTITGDGRASAPAEAVQRTGLPIDPDLAPGDPAAPAVDHRPATRPAGRTERRAEPSVLAAIALGGALGAQARYGLAQLVHVAPGDFPWATFVTNVTGSFALGVVLTLIVERFPPTRYLRPFVATGFLGAYTTYSTFAVETDLLIRDGHALVGVVYAAASLLAGLTAVWAGIWGARILPLPHRREDMR